MTYLQDVFHLLLAHWSFKEARIRKMHRDSETKEETIHHLRDSKYHGRMKLDFPSSSGSIWMHSMTLALWQANFSPRFKESWQEWNPRDYYKHTRNSEYSISSLPHRGPTLRLLETRTEQVVRLRSSSILEKKTHGTSQKANRVQDLTGWTCMNFQISFF